MGELNEKCCGVSASNEAQGGRKWWALAVVGSGVDTVETTLASYTLPVNVERVFFTNGGAEANENAVRMARLHTGRQKVLAAYRSYHGATATAIALTGEPRRWPSEPGAPGIVHFFGPYAYRSSFWATTPEEECERALAHLGVEFVPFTTSEADVAAELWQRGMRSFSLADRACLATAIVRGLPVVTADKAWSRLSLEVPVKIIR